VSNYAEQIHKSICIQCIILLTHGRVHVLGSLGALAARVGVCFKQAGKRFSLRKAAWGEEGDDSRLLGQPVQWRRH